jgi:uncharacterized protein with NAD-binding domain and iron-sulfur cluster
MKVAVVGAGVSGLAAAYELARSGGARVTVYEEEECLGGHAKSVGVDGVGRVDLGFMVFNRVGTTTSMLSHTPWVPSDIYSSATPSRSTPWLFSFLTSIIYI